MSERCDVRSKVCLSEGSKSGKWRVLGYHEEPPLREITATVEINCSGQGCRNQGTFDYTRVGSAPEVMPDGSHFGDHALNWAKATIASSCPRDSQV